MINKLPNIKLLIKHINKNIDVLNKIQDKFLSINNISKLNNGIVLYIVLFILLLGVEIKKEMVQFMEQKAKIKQPLKCVYEVLLAAIHLNYYKYEASDGLISDKIKRFTQILLLCLS